MFIEIVLFLLLIQVGQLSVTDESMHSLSSCMLQVNSFRPPVYEQYNIIAENHDN